MNQNIIRYKQRLENLFKEVALITDMRIQGEWAKYLCVLSSGYLESSFRIIITDYVSKNSSPRVIRYNEPIISNLTNCKHGKIVKTLEQFDTNWAQLFLTEIETKSKIPNEIKDSIDSLVQNRHDIAHGNNVGIGYVRVKEYFEKAHKAIEIIDNIMR